MSNWKDSSTLKALGLNKTNEWLLHDKKAEAFFQYLATEIDNSNVLSLDELILYEDLKASGQYLEGEALDEEIKKLEMSFPGILTVSDQDVEELERELKILEKDTGERTERVSRMKAAKKKQLKDIADREKKVFELECKEKQLEEECHKKTQQLTEIQKSNQNKIEELKQLYTQPQHPPPLVYQMPLDQHFQKCQHLLVQLELFVRKNFNVTHYAEDMQSDWQSHAPVIELKNRIQEIENKKFEEKLSEAGFRNVMENIEQFKNIDVNEMRAMIEDMQVETDNMALEFEDIHKEAGLLIEQTAEREIIKVFNEHFKGKRKRAMKRLFTIKSVEGLIENVLLLCELLWVVMQLDLERLKNREDNSEEIGSQAQDCAKRVRQMKILGKRDPIAALNENFLVKLQDVLLENLLVGREEVATLEDCLATFVKHEEKLQAMINSSANLENFKKVQDVMRQISEQSDLLREFIFSGPTSRPTLQDSKFMLEIHDRELKKFEIEKEFENVKERYKKNIVEPWGNDRYYRMEKKLWIYFLTEPKKVLECIKEVQAKAAQQGCPEYKALNISGVVKNN